MRHRLRLVLLPALLVGVALALAACEVSVGDKTIDADSVEQQIVSNMESQGASVESVDCPGGEEAKQGNTFDCTVTLDDGSTRTAAVELVDDEGTFRYNVPGADEGEDTSGGEETAEDTGGGEETAEDTGGGEEDTGGGEEDTAEATEDGG